jgi:hypothetical protein
MSAYGNSFPNSAPGRRLRTACFSPDHTSYMGKRCAEVDLGPVARWLVARNPQLTSMCDGNTETQIIDAGDVCLLAQGEGYDIQPR